MNFATVVIARDGPALFAKNDAMRIRVPDDLVARLQAHADKPTILGIRPEGLRMANSGDPPDMSFEAVVEVAEQLGSEIILDLSVGGTSMVASVEPTVRVRHGEKIRLAINPAGLRFFDGKTELAL